MTLHVAPLSPAPDAAQAFAARLRAEGLVGHDALLHAMDIRRRHGGRLAGILLDRGLVGEEVLYAAMARHWGARQADPLALPPEPGLLSAWGGPRALREGLLPWRRAGGATVVLAAHPEDFARCEAELREVFGPVAMGLAPAARIEAAVLAQEGPAMARAAELSVPARESSRGWGGGNAGLWVVAGLALLGLGVWAAPWAMGALFAGWAVLTLAATNGLKALALLAAPRTAPDPGPAPVVARLPVVSVMVALYREANIAPRLVRRLERLDYPRDRLDIVLAVESEDHMTRAALAGAGLPPWMQVVVVPPGRVKTKPRALNYALGLCRGTIIGVYDAEDAPAPDQIRRVVQRFHERGPQVACLQGVLDFYNPRANWLARCFTMDYAAWFRVVLPGLARLGLPVPLGGTTLFFRREALEGLGAWDAWNVTEDADLGIRLCRHGYRTELIDTVTEEEANCRPWPWVRQRSRWLKGYMMTWAVHMRDPRLLWRQLGPRGFWGFQVLFLGTLSQFLLAPVLWSFWLVAFGLWHPVAAALPAGAMLGLTGLFVASEVVTLLAAWVGMRRTAHRMSWVWLPALHLYFPMGALAGYKALWELVACPFYWDKTAHGLAQQAPAPPAAIPRPPLFAPPPASRARALAIARELHPLLLPPTSPFARIAARPPLAKGPGPPPAVH